MVKGGLDVRLQVIDEVVLQGEQLYAKYSEDLIGVGVKGTA